MDLDELEIAQALGVSVEKQEPADPAPTAGTANGGTAAEGQAQDGENAQELADPENDENNSVSESSSGSPAKRVSLEEGGVTEREDVDDLSAAELSGVRDDVQSKEERARNAAARREAEKKAAIEAAVLAVRQEEEAKFNKTMEDFFVGAGLKNPLDGNKPITNMDEYAEYKRAFTAQQMEKELRAGKLTPELLEKVVSENPVIKKAGEAIQAAEREAEEARRVQTEAKINGELQEIAKLDPSIGKLEDLLHMEKSLEFRGLVNKGYTLLDAFRLVNFDKLTQRSAAAAQQQALNKANSKNHLNPISTRGTGALSVPPEVMEEYRQFNPGMSDKEIQAHYNKYVNQTTKT